MLLGMRPRDCKGLVDIVTCYPCPLPDDVIPNSRSSDGLART
jgi:ferritin-like protein